MAARRLTWKRASHGSAIGSVGELRLFTVGYGMRRQEAMQVLHTQLPGMDGDPRLGQVHLTPEDAQAAAQQVLDEFVAALTEGGAR